MLRSNPIWFRTPRRRNDAPMSGLSRTSCSTSQLSLHRPANTKAWRSSMRCWSVPISRFPASHIQLRDDGDGIIIIIIIIIIITTLDSLNRPNPSLAEAEEVARVQGSLQSCCFEHLLISAGGTNPRSETKRDTKSHCGTLSISFNMINYHILFTIYRLYRGIHIQNIYIYICIYFSSIYIYISHYISLLCLSIYMYIVRMGWPESISR